MQASDAEAARGHIQYTTVNGIFLQDEPSTDASTLDYTVSNFGLIDRAYDTDKEYDPNRKKTQWQRFKHEISHLNGQSSQHEQYKLLYLGRHGEGFHNIGEILYGMDAWRDHYSKLPGNETINWTDAHLTPKGEQQALTANHFWGHMITTQRIPLPENYYVSPLDRCLHTANLTFSNLPLPTSQPFRPVVKELLRETIGEHTCDQRNTRTYISTHYPTYVIEPGFSEDDELWSPNVRESDEETDMRVRKLLDDIFTNDHSTFISLTSHSGAISALLRVLGHREFRLRTGGVIPVLVRAEWKSNP